ncbi:MULTISPECIES: class I fructose-bisphosphate aldolase [Anaerotruncus]|uniref:class I fructose-bisphosphate aldolase n=1 Tax=Anaerotruncus TaxID=244127 RepID=UPI00082D8AD7|nr:MULTISPECIES: fructose-bisphosphate aldolase [Anaerotruncus]RGX56473.1 fructose-bisphosphate aldolase [Anaerotruncus sp. AF02-27]
MAFLGKSVRLNRLMPQGDGLYLGLTVDHAMARGVLPGLDTIADTLEKLLAGDPNAITMHKGIAEHCFEQYAGRVPLVLKCSTFSPYQPGADVIVADIEEAVRMGADAVSVGCIVGGDNQPEQIRTLSEFSKAAASAGMPLVTHIYPRGNLIAQEDRMAWQNVLYAARVAAELGVDLIKTNYPGSPEDFEKVVRGTPTRVLVAGGAPGGTIDSYLQMTRDVIDAGGKGVTYGRFVFQYQNPTALVKTLRKIVHEGYSVRQAKEYLAELESK